MPPSSGVPQPHPPLKTSKTSTTASTPGAMPSSPGVPQPYPPLKTSKTSPLASTPGAISPSSGVPLHPSHKTSKASPTASTERYHLPLTSLNHIHTHPKKARHLHIPKTPDSHQSYISWKRDSNSRPLHYE